MKIVNGIMLRAIIYRTINPDTSELRKIPLSKILNDMKFRHLFICAIVLTLSYPSFSQYTVINNQDAMIYTPMQIEQLNERTCQLISKSRSKLITDSIYVYNIYYFQTFRKLTKKDFLDKLFFEKLNLQSLYEKDKDGNSFPSSRSIILNKQDKFIGVSWIHHFTKSNECSPFVYIWELPVIREKEKRNIMCYFQIIDMPCRESVIFGRTYKNEIIVFHQKQSESIKITTIKEFIEKYWSEYFD